MITRAGFLWRTLALLGLGHLRPELAPDRRVVQHTEYRLGFEVDRRAFGPRSAELERQLRYQAGLWMQEQRRRLGAHYLGWWA